MNKISPEDQQNAVFIQNLREGVTLEHLYVEFRKYGKVKNVIFVKSKLQATVIFENDIDAKEAIRMGNHSQILSKEIIVTKVYATEELSQKKNHNLFIKNVPEKLESKLLQNYLATEFGDIISLFLKKNSVGENKGYGYVQFDSITSYDNILKHQSQQSSEQITLPNSEFSFTVEPFGRPLNTMNKAKIMGFFESLVTQTEKAAKEEDVRKVLNSILEESNSIVPNENINMKFFFEYKESKQNFWASIEFSAATEETEELVQLFIKDRIRKSFGTTPEITFKSTFSNERNIIIQGLKEQVTNKIIVEWLNKYLQITLAEANIRIFTPRPRDNNSQRKVANQCLISFDTRQQGKELMIYAAQRINFEYVAEITEDLHKITINMSRNEVREIKKHQKKMKDLYNPVITKQTVDEVISNPPIFNPFFQPRGPGHRQHQIPPFQFSQQGNMPFPMQLIPQMMGYQTMPQQVFPIQPAPVLVHVPATPIAPINVFTQYQNFNQEEKAKQVNTFAKYLVTKKEEFLKLKIEDQTKVLGQIIYYKINNFDKIENPTSFEVFKDQSPEQALAQLNHFKSEAAKITPMLIDTEVLETDDIIEIISDDNELMERCKEAIELLLSNAESNPTPQ